MVKRPLLREETIDGGNTSVGDDKGLEAELGKVNLGGALPGCVMVLYGQMKTEVGDRRNQ